LVDQNLLIGLKVLIPPRQIIALKKRIMKFSTIFIIAFFISNLLAAQEEFFDTVIPMGNYKVTTMVEDGIVFGKIKIEELYFGDDSKTIVYNLKNEVFDTISLKLGDWTYLTNDSLWLVNQLEDEFEITNTITKDTKSYKFQYLYYLGNSLFQAYSHQNFDIIHLVNPHKKDFVATFKRQGYGRTVISGIENYGVMDFDNDKTTFYDFKGNEIFNVNGTSLTPYNGVETVYFDTHDGLNSVINQRGETIVPRSRRRFKLEPMIMLDQGIFFKNYEGDKDRYIDFDGNELEGQIYYSSEMDHVKKVFESKQPNKLGLFFENSKIKTEIQYEEIKVHPGYRVWGSKNYIEAIKANRKVDYYNPRGELIYTSGKYRTTKFLKDIYFLVGDGENCGIVDNQDKVIVPLKKGLCSGSCAIVSGVPYFYLTNRARHLFLYNGEGKEIFSMTDDSYTSRTRHVKTIWGNSHKIPSEQEFVIIESKKSNSYSLFHLPTRTIILEGYTHIKFSINDHIFIKKNGQSGLLKRKK